MSSEEDYESDYDTRPEAGRPKQHLDSDESDNERSSSGPRRPLRFLNDDGDDDYDDDTPMIVEKTQQERSTSASAPTATTTTVNPIRQPTAFAAAPNLANDSPGSALHKTPIHATVSKDGTSMFCVEGYVNTPELSAGRGGGLSQGLPANGPYKSLFRARSESRGSNIASATTIALDAALHVLADAAQSPEALSPISVSTASPAPAQTPAPASKNRRKPSPLAASSPSSSVAPLDSTATAQPSPAASINANASSSQSHMIIDNASHHPRPRPTQTRSRGGGGKSKQKEKVTSRSSARADGNDMPVYEGHSSLRPQFGPLIPAAEPREMESTAQFRLRSVQKSRADSKEVASVPPAPTPVNGGSYDHAGGYYPSYFEAGPSDSSNTVAHTVREGGQSLSAPFPKTWESPGPSPPIVNDYPASARMTSKESSPTADSRSLTPGTKPRMLTLLIEDRRHGTDELAEVHVPLKTMGEGYLWADAKDLSAALQSGPSRIDGPAKVLTMRGKYRQTFLRVSADGEETSQSANLKVETDRTLSIIVEGIPDPRVVKPAPFLSSNPSPLVTAGPAGLGLNMGHPLTPVSNDLGPDGFHATPPDHMEVGQRPDAARKRKRETSLSHIQRLQFDSPESRSFTDTIDTSATTRTMTPHEHHTRPWKSRRSDPISPFDGGYMSDSPPIAYRGHKRAHRRDQIASGSHLYRSGYETDQPLPSVRARMSSGIMAAPEQHQGSDRRVSSLLQPPPTCAEGPQRMHDKVVSFLRDSFMEDASHWNEFTRDRAHVGSLSNVALLRVYWFAQERLDNWIGSRLPKHLNYKKVEMRHVLDALGATEDWYRECNETLSLVVAYGERGERYENPRAVAASRDRAPKSHVASSGPTHLLVLLRQIHEEYCERVRARVGQGRESSIE